MPTYLCLKIYCIYLLSCIVMYFYRSQAKIIIEENGNLDIGAAVDGVEAGK